MSLDVAEMICSIPSLEMVVLLQGAFHHCFFATLATKGKESKVSISSTIVMYVQVFNSNFTPLLPSLPFYILISFNFC